MIHPLPLLIETRASMIMWLKLTALIGLMGKLRLPIPHSLSPYLSLIWFLGHTTNSPGLVPLQNDTALPKEPQFVLSSSPQVWSTFLSTLTAQLDLSLLACPLIPTRAPSHSRIFAGLFKSISHAEGYKGALLISLWDLKVNLHRSPSHDVQDYLV